jgi:thiol-disulfide isomerase/thioredoxin
MKSIYFTLFLITAISFSQSEVPNRYWLDDSSFEKTISGKSAFEDDIKETIVVEFWAKFNEVNCFSDWEELKDVNYYRVDISKAPNAKKKYRVRMAPTIIIFKNGMKEKVFKAGLDLLLPVGLNEIQETINEINNANKF